MYPAEPPTPPGLAPPEYTPSLVEKVKATSEAERRFWARKRNEAQLEEQVMALQQENQRLRETIEHQNNRIQRQKGNMGEQIKSIYHLKHEKSHYHSERDFFREELCRFIPLDQLPPRPPTPYEPSKALPRPEDLGEDVLIKYLSGNTNEPQRPPLETQSAHSAFPPFPPLPPHSFDTRDSISTERSESQIQSQSTRELSELFPQSQDPPRYDQRAYGYRDFLLNGTANVPSSSPNPFLKLDNPSYSGFGQSMPAKRYVRHPQYHILNIELQKLTSLENTRLHIDPFAATCLAVTARRALRDNMVWISIREWSIQTNISAGLAWYTDALGKIALGPTSVGHVSRF